MRKSFLVILACAVSGLGATANQNRQPTFDLRVTPLALEAKTPSAQPQLTVSARGILLSWVEQDGKLSALRFAERTPTGWTPARTVASGDNWFVNWADVPSVLRLPSGAIVGHWLQKSGPDTYAYDVRLAQSTDEGKTFSPSFLPHHDGTKTEHGFASLFPAGKGFGLVWLDGRQMKAGSHSGTDHSAAGAMTLRFAAFDGAWKQIADAPVDLRVCECCSTTAVATSDGIVAAYRNRSEAEIRDIYVSRLENGKWTEGRPVANDNWNINGCPVNGPMLAARGRDVALAWFTGNEDQNRSFVAFSKDAGRTFGKPVRVDDEASLGRVDVELLDDGAALVSWIEHSSAGAQFKIRRVDANGGRSAAVTVANVASSRISGFPRVARHGDELVFAWVDAGSATAANRSNQTQVRAAVARIPATK